MDVLTGPLAIPDPTRLVVVSFADTGSLVLMRRSPVGRRLQLLNVHPPDIPRLRAALEKWDAAQP